MDWRQFVMDLGPLPSDAVEAVFARHGAAAVTLSDAGDNPVLEPGPGETPLWTDTRITGLFSPNTDFDALCRDLRQEFELAELPTYRIDELEDRAWEREWLKDFHPVPFGERLWVCPRGQRPDAADAIIVELDPGLAFGTGTHPTTALCLQWLDAQAAALAGKTVLDFGCGSGILAIAALKLGASSACCSDIDPQAITATSSNASDNDVANYLTASIDRPDGQYEIVLANILAQPLIENAEWLCDRLVSGGSLVLSGILREQADDVCDAYDAWIDFDPQAGLEDWVRLSGRKR